MSLFFNTYATCGLLLAILLLFLKYCRNALKIYEGYPVLHLFPFFLYQEVLGKIPKNIPLNSYVFKIIIESCMQHMKEGLCIAYTTGPILLVFGEEPVKILSNAKSAASKPEEFYRLFKDAHGPGLITHNGKKWKKHRQMINPAFSLGMLKDKVPLFNKHGLAFVKDVEILVGKQSVNVFDAIKCHYLNSLFESLFGLKQTEENRDEYLKYFRSLDNLNNATVYRSIHPWLKWKCMLRTFAYGREFLRDYEEVSRFTTNKICEREGITYYCYTQCADEHWSISDQYRDEKALLKLKEQIISNETSDSDCLDKSVRDSFTYILFQHHLNDPTFTFEDLHGEISTFICAGYETVSYSTRWCLFMLGLHPEVQEKAYNEVQSASTNNYISYEDCSSFTYLESVILETLRLYPVVPLFGRQLTEDVQCGERNIPKDTIIAFSPYVIHRNPDIYPDPENFDPERFLGRKNINPWNYMPFSAGYRNCIGKKYALIEMKIFLAHFLRNFRITSLDRREDIVLYYRVILSTATPLHFHIERR